ncbi:MAG TPA: ABC transporter ATP-binding protein [Ktedonosporobacter sp.]|jgi:ATP-binding cassette subfamily B protein/ATP-binding cassette subfamily C protein|nr:ABC transporter ATP-binding protein [Ktedonosporobacter sp.]
MLFRRYFVLLAAYLRPQWWRSLLLAALLIGNTGLQLLNPQLLKMFIDTALARGVSLMLLVVALLYFGIALLKQFVSIADTYLGEHVAWTATNRLRGDLVAHCLSLDLSFHKAHTPGELIERIDGDIDTLSNFFSRLLIQLVGSGLLLLGIVAIFFQISWIAGVGVSLYAFIFLSVIIIMSKRLVPLWVAQRQASADFYGFLGEHLEGTAEIRANGATAAVMHRFFLLLRSWFPITLKARMATTRLHIANFVLISGGLLLTLVLGVYLRSLQPATVTVGTIFAMYSYTFLLIGPIWSIQAQLQDLQQVEACMQRIDELLGTTSALHDGRETSLPQGPLSVEFKHVTFEYDAGVPVLRDVSFSVEPGKILGVLGRTGSGKTTLARLIFRFYDSQQGCVYVGGMPVQEMRLQELRRHIGVVTQDVQLFQASVRDNLTFFDREIPDERILATIAALGLSAWYGSLPQGLDTMLGTGAVGLSAGEAQLLAFTRVFLHDPGVIILDEASSRLDPPTAALLENAMDKLLAGRTTIIIAHRLSTVQRTDAILILEHGALLEYGERESLARDPSAHFFRLLQTDLEGVLA